MKQFLAPKTTSSFLAFQAKRRSSQVDCSESGSVNLPTVKRIIRLLTQSARVRVPGRKYGHQPWTIRWNVCCRAITALVDALFHRDDAGSNPAARQGWYKICPEQQLSRVTCSNSRATWPGAITGSRRQPGQVRMASPRSSRRCALYPVISNC